MAFVSIFFQKNVLKPFKQGILCLLKVCYKMINIIRKHASGMAIHIWFSFISFLPFLYKGVRSASFKKERKLTDLIAMFMLVHKNSANISLFSLIILAAISAFCEGLVLSNLRIFFSTSSIFTYLK